MATVSPVQHQANVRMLNCSYQLAYDSLVNIFAKRLSTYLINACSVFRSYRGHG